MPAVLGRCQPRSTPRARSPSPELSLWLLLQCDLHSPGLSQVIYSAWDQLCSTLSHLLGCSLHPCRAGASDEKDSDFSGYCGGHRPKP